MYVHSVENLKQNYRSKMADGQLAQPFIKLSEILRLKSNQILTVFNRKKGCFGKSNLKLRMQDLE